MFIQYNCATRAGVAVLSYPISLIMTLAFDLTLALLCKPQGVNRVVGRLNKALTVKPSPLEGGLQVVLIVPRGGERRLDNQGN